MKLHSIVIDDFFDSGFLIRAHAISTAYKDQLSTDGVVYPDISIEIPEEIKQEFKDKLETLVGGKIKEFTPFLRLSRQGVPVPHQAHTDAILGQWTALVYLNRPEQCIGGTSLLKHVSGMDTHPSTPEQEELWRQDTNDPTKWLSIGGCAMAFNRLYMVDSRLFHRAEPIGGFGDSNETGRLVMVAFFTLEERK